MDKSRNLIEIARIITLIGSILESIVGGLLCVMTFGILGLICVPIIFLSWYARHKALQGSQAWNIYGIVHGCLLNWVTAAGHIVLFIGRMKEGEESYQIL